METERGEERCSTSIFFSRNGFVGHLRICMWIVGKERDTFQLILKIRKSMRNLGGFTNRIKGDGARNLVVRPVALEESCQRELFPHGNFGRFADRVADANGKFNNRSSLFVAHSRFDV